MIAQELCFSYAKDLGEIPTASLPTGRQNRGEIGSNRRFSTNISPSKMYQIQPMNDKPPLKGAWSGSHGPFFLNFALKS